MCKYAAMHGWATAVRVKEIGSGGHTTRRQMRKKLVEEIDVVLVWRLNRWGRASDLYFGRRTRARWLQGQIALKGLMVAKACNVTNLLVVPFERSLAA